MRSLIKLVIFFLFIFSLYYDETVAEDSPCGDWEPYKDEKCFKIFNNVVFQNYEDANKTCSQQENSSSLVSIRSLEEQEFFSNLLFKTHNVVDSVWIGAKNSSNKFKWPDGSELSFTNWAEGSPSNIIGNNCVQIAPEGSIKGKWVDEPCNKKNLLVCQKMQTWSLSRLQTTLKYLTESLTEEINQRTNSFNYVKIELEDTKKQLKNLQHNPILPIGFIYVQLPNEKSPTEIWPYMTWNDVSSAYAGVFFRVIGGDAASFGQVQQNNIPSIKFRVYYDGPSFPSFKDNNNLYEKNMTGFNDIRASTYFINGMGFNVSEGEVRPRNMAIRVWKRVG